MPPQSGSSSAAMLAQLGNLGALASMGGGALGVKNPNDMQVALLKSRTTEYAMIERFQLQAEYHKRYISSARARWEKMTSIDSGLKDGLIRLSVTDRDPRRAAELANGWVEEYRRVTANLALTEAAQRRMFFEREVNGERGELERAEDNLKDTEDRTGVLELDGQARALIASAAQLRAQIAAKQVEIRAMREFATSENPDMARAEQELSGMEGQLAAMDVDSDHSTGDLIAPKGKVTQTGLEFARALREEKFHEAMYELLTRQYEVARVDEARQGSIVQVVDPAIPPDRPGSHYRLWIFLAGLVFALPLALITAWIVELVSIALALRRRLGSWTAVLEQGWTGEPQSGEPR
ncbi:MAG: chain length determinant family protein [Terracidiphilus sp.]